MEWTWKKTVAVCVGFALVFVTPMYLVSNGMMDFYQKRIDRNPEADSSKWLLLKSADICYSTYRPERAAEYYLKYLENYPEDERRPYVLLRYGFSLEESHRNADAIEVFQQFIEEYPELEDDRRRAQQGIDRIRYVRPR